MRGPLQDLWAPRTNQPELTSATQRFAFRPMNAVVVWIMHGRP